MEENTYDNYFSNRNVDEQCYARYCLPIYVKQSLPKHKAARILDIGCGFGQMLGALKTEGYLNLIGIDLSPQAVRVCMEKGINAVKILDLEDFCNSFSGDKFDFIMMSHVLEHIPKEKIIRILRLVKERLLSATGLFYIAVPNAQSNAGCYWAYEDFTHYTLFTAGSLSYVLRSAGFSKVEFLDPLGCVGSPFFIGCFKHFFLKLYKLNYCFWNHVTSSSFHKPSPQIFTFELKVLAS